MTEEKKEYFNSMNKAWDLLRPHVKDAGPYKRAMSDLFNMFFRELPDKFSDPWWETTVCTFLDYANSNFDKELGVFIGELAMGLLNYREHEYKLNDSTQDMFYKDIESAFTHERNRIAGS